jgi:PAS domain S-box-containing protein
MMPLTLAKLAQAMDPLSPTFVAPKAAVLIVDDNASKRLALRGILAQSGHEIVEADSGVAALRCLLERDFAVILLDVRMPVMDGYTTASLIRKRQKSETTPIIFVTAYDRDEVAETDGYALGAVDFIFAPVRPLDLRSKVNVFAGLFVQTQQLAAQFRAVQMVADELRVLTDAAPIGIFQTDADNRYVYTNPGWSEITGISAEDALGTKLHSIVPVDDRVALLARAPYHGEFSDRFEIVRPDLESRTVVLTWRSIPDARSDRSGSVGTLADVTAEAKAEATMAAARDAALAATIMQKNFTASASHELKTPTTAILGFCEEIMENDAMTAEDRSFLEIVHRNAQRLNRLIEDLLIVGQDDLDATMMDLEPTDVIAVVARVIDNFTPAAQQADITLTVEPHTAAARAMADPLRLEQALNNLVSNAMKFTHVGGQVTISVDTTSAQVNIRVIDDGIGIAPADTDRVFDRFYRAQAALDASVTGSGLGLAIAKGMIEAQNGTIAVSSEIGRGSSFSISLPTADEPVRVISVALSAGPDGVVLASPAPVGDA